MLLAALSGVESRVELCLNGVRPVDGEWKREKGSHMAAYQTAYGQGPLYARKCKGLGLDEGSPACLQR